MSLAAIEITDSASQHDHAVVGPNAVLQLSAPLRQAGGEEVLRAVFGRADEMHWLTQPPTAMVSELRARWLFDAVLAECGGAKGADILSQAGIATAHYIRMNRIPAPVRFLLRLLPPTLAGRMMLQAIERHAWTFAGSGVCRTGMGEGFTVTIENNPLATPGCPWHRAVLETLFRELVSERAVLDHPECCQQGGAVCRFQVEIVRTA